MIINQLGILFTVEFIDIDRMINVIKDMTNIMVNITYINIVGQLPKSNNPLLFCEPSLGFVFMFKY